MADLFGVNTERDMLCRNSFSNLCEECGYQHHRKLCVISGVKGKQKRLWLDLHTICSDFGAHKNKVCNCFNCFPIQTEFWAAAEKLGEPSALQHPPISISFNQPTTPAGSLPRPLGSPLTNIQWPVKVNTLKRTRSGTTRVLDMSSGSVEMKGMSLVETVAVLERALALGPSRIQGLALLFSSVWL